MRISRFKFGQAEGKNEVANDLPDTRSEWDNRSLTVSQPDFGFCERVVALIFEFDLGKMIFIKTK